MPGIKTHDIFHKELKKRISDDTLLKYYNFDKYNIFSTGHDLLLYKNFYKVWNMPQKYRDLSLSVAMQETEFQEFVYNYIKIAKKEGVMNDLNVRAFLSFGYVMHHLLDAIIHPYVIYMAGDHLVVKENETWNHGRVETLLDGYLMLTLEGKEPKKYKMHKDFKVSRKVVNKNLIRVLDRTIFMTYQVPNQGKGMIKALKDAKLNVRVIKYDPFGIKAAIFKLVDKKWHGYGGFSNYRDYADATKYLNKNRETWLNPMFGDKSNHSFMELFEFALKKGVEIIENLEVLYDQDVITRDDVYKVIPDMAATHGGKCGQGLEINYVRKDSVKKKSFKKKIIKKIEKGKKINNTLYKSLYKKNAHNFTNRFKMNIRKIIFPIVRMISNKALDKENIVLRRPKLDKRKAYIFAPTHSFDEDLKITMATIDRNAYLVLGLTEQLMFNPDMYVGYFGTGLIHMFKDSKKSRLECREKMLKVLKNKNSLIVYPEGAFNHSQNKLILELYDSIFFLAKETDVEIVPIAHYSRYDSDKIYTIIGDPVSVRDYELSEKKLFMTKLRDIMATQMWNLMEDYAPRVKREDLGTVEEYYHERMYEYLSVMWDPRNDDWIDEEILTKDKDEFANLDEFKNYVRKHWRDAQEDKYRKKKIPVNKYHKFMIY